MTWLRAALHLLAASGVGMIIGVFVALRSAQDGGQVVTLVILGYDGCGLVATSVYILRGLRAP